MNVQRTIGDQQTKIGDDADCPVEGAITWIGANMIPGQEQGTIRITSLTSNDNLISQSSDLSGFYTKTKFKSSGSASKYKSKDVQRFSEVYTDSGKSAVKSCRYVIKHIGRRAIIKEHHNRRNSWNSKFKTVDTRSPGTSRTPAAESEKEYYNESAINKINRYNSINKTLDSVNESENSSDLTQKFNSTSLNCTSNTTKDLSISSSYVQGFELGNPKWRGPLYTAYANSQKNKNRDCLNKTLDIWEWIEPTSSTETRKGTVSPGAMLPNSPKGSGGTETPATRVKKNSKLNSTMPYDTYNFLTDELRDELLKISIAYPSSEFHDESSSQSNASELISDESTQYPRRNENFPRKTVITESSSQRSSNTFITTMKICKSVAKKIKRILGPVKISEPTTTKSNSTATAEDSIYEAKNIQTLKQEVKIQETIIYQAKKGLAVCNSRKEFQGSIEQVELARLILLAELKKSAVLAEIKKLRLNNNDYYRQCCEKGDITVKDFSFPLKEDFSEDQALTRDFVEWFVITVSQGTTVWATRAVSCPIKSQIIIFTEGIFFPDVSPNFKITVRIYSLRTCKTTFNHDSKSNLKQTQKSSKFRSLKKFISKKPNGLLSPKQIQRTECSAEIENNFFVLSGMVELYLRDLSFSAPWPLNFLLPDSVLCGTMNLTLSSKLHLTASHSGFLTRGYGSGNHVDWNRKWCVLDGEILKFWKYPDDQDDKEPVYTIDLTNCISKEIKIAGSSLCARARTLLIEISRQKSKLDSNGILMECHSSYTTVRYLLCCDTARDLGQWISKLNQVIFALRDWNVTKQFPDDQVTDL